MSDDLSQLRRSPRDFALWGEAQRQMLGGHRKLALGNYKKLTSHYPGVAELWYELGNVAVSELDRKSVV